MVRVTKYTTKLTETKRVVLEKEASMNYPELSHIIRSPEDVADLGKRVMHICVNTKNKVTGVFEISHGTVNASLVTPREVFQKALLANAVSIILMHNHPSGESTPSREDIEVTKRLVEAGKIVGVEVLDHIIIGDRYVSLKGKGYV